MLKYFIVHIVCIWVMGIAPVCWAPRDNIHMPEVNIHLVITWLQLESSFSNWMGVDPEILLRKARVEIP